MGARTFGRRGASCMIIVWSSLSAFVTAVAGVLALMALRPVLETRAA